MDRRTFLLASAAAAIPSDTFWWEPYMGLPPGQRYVLLRMTNSGRMRNSAWPVPTTGCMIVVGHKRIHRFAQQFGEYEFTYVMALHVLRKHQRLALVRHVPPAEFEAEAQRRAREATRNSEQRTLNRWS